MSYDWPKNYEEKVLNFAKANNLKGKSLDAFVEKCYEHFSNSKIPIYEPAGLLVAHSMGEPATQLILRTKHYAGAADVSIGSGIERVEELVDARSKTKSPTMTIFIRKDCPRDDKAFRGYLKQIIYKKLTDVCDIKEDLNEKSVIVHLKDDAITELGLSVDEIKDKIKNITKVKPIEDKNTLTYIFNDLTLVSVRKFFTKMLDLNIKGIDNITDAIITEVNGEKVINTTGTNLKQMFNLDFVDVSRSYTNDIFETYKVLGIEAARYLLVSELDRVYKEIGLDLRHILLLSDSMCFDGSVKGVVRTGIVSMKDSPLARAAFEQTEKVIFDAAFNGEVEEFNGVVENVMAGLPIKVGIGKIDLLMKFNSEKGE